MSGLNPPETHNIEDLSLLNDLPCLIVMVSTFLLPSHPSISASLKNGISLSFKIFFISVSILSFFLESTKAFGLQPKLINFLSRLNEDELFVNITGSFSGTTPYR